MAEAIPTPTLEQLLEAVRETLDDNVRPGRRMNQPRQPTSHLDAAVESDAVAICHKYRRLLTLHLRINLLSQVYSTAGYTHGRPTNTVLQIVGHGALADMWRGYESAERRGTDIRNRGAKVLSVQKCARITNDLSTFRTT